MIQITAQMRVLVAIEPVDGRKYAPSIVMWSHGEKAWKGLGGRRWVSPANCT
jgi:hypothetical protein